MNIGGVVDVPAVAEFAAGLKGVAHVEQNLFSCSQDAQDKMRDIVAAHNLNRVVVASCSPRTHEMLFQETLQAAGLNKYLFEMANIRDQNSWVHREYPEIATRKAKDLVAMAVGRARRLKPLAEKKIPIVPSALVVGGGAAGLTAALSIADQGFEVTLVEREKHLGGLAQDLTATIEGADIQSYLNRLIDRARNHQKIRILTNTLVVDFSGFQGNFSTEVMVGAGPYEQTIKHGVTVIATGAEEYRPKEYLHGEDDRVMTQIELGKRLEQGLADRMNKVVMIQCVGSRNEESPNCSRVCCQSAVKNALHIKERNPKAQVFILYRDMRTYGLLEDYYTEARRQGVIFARYEPDNPPKVHRDDDGLWVDFRDFVLDRDIRVPADILALSAGARPRENDELASIMKLARGPEGFFMEAHVKLRPVDMAKDGVFVCGTAHGPKLLSESIAQAMAAAARASVFLSRPEIKLSAGDGACGPREVRGLLRLRVFLPVQRAAHQRGRGQ